MNLLRNPLATRLYQTYWEISVELYMNWQFGCIDNLHHHFGNCLVSTQIQTSSDSPEQLQ
jgi:hypothetical protein